jgi:hypothetical protein
MRRVLFLVLVSSIVGIANAGVLLTVNGKVDPGPLTGDDILNIGLWGDGSIAVGSLFFMGLEVGSEATLDISTVNILYPGISKWVVWEDEAWIADYLNVQNPFIGIQLSDPVMPPETSRPLAGQLVDNILLSPQNTGVATLWLFDLDGIPIDSQLIGVQQVAPEPASLLIISIGTLFIGLRRKRR